MCRGDVAAAVVFEQRGPAASTAERGGQGVFQVVAGLAVLAEIQPVELVRFADPQADSAPTIFSSTNEPTAAMIQVKTVAIS